MGRPGAPAGKVQESHIIRPLFINERWIEQALCAQVDPEIFFPDEGEKPFAAIEVCRRCPVRKQCLEWALREREPYGVWGGTTAKRREELNRGRGRRGKSRPRCGTESGARSHYRHRETPCGPCLEAANAAARRRKQDRKHRRAS